MRNWIVKLGLAAAIGVIPGAALAQSGEVFELGISGTLRCPEFTEKVGPRNAPILFLRLVDGFEWDIHFDSPSTDPIPVIGLTLPASDTKQVFNGAQFADDAFIALEGTAVLDKNGNVKKASGVLIDQFLSDIGCFFSGKFKTRDRVPG